MEELQKLFHDANDIIVGFAESRIGGRPENQDTFGAVKTSRGFLVTVCDGMGGGPGGKTASSIAVNEILAGIRDGAEDETVPNVIIKAVRRANMAILEAGNENPELKGMGSTATVLLISEQSAFAAHVGDSRIYQFRGRRKVFRTDDHSMVFDLVRQKVITEEQARLSAQSNVITRALGMRPDIEVEIHELSYEKGDRFLLCSDGIHGTMPERDLIKMATTPSNNTGAVTNTIATFVDNQGRDNGGGHDNLTIAIVETKVRSKLRPATPKWLKLWLPLAVVVLVIAAVIAYFLLAGTPWQDTPDPAQTETTNPPQTEVLTK